jgi:hypothetical protein
MAKSDKLGAIIVAAQNFQINFAGPSCVWQQELPVLTFKGYEFAKKYTTKEYIVWQCRFYVSSYEIFRLNITMCLTVIFSTAPI